MRVLPTFAFCGLILLVAGASHAGVPDGPLLILFTIGFLGCVGWLLATSSR